MERQVVRESISISNSITFKNLKIRCREFAKEHGFDINELKIEIQPYSYSYDSDTHYRMVIYGFRKEYDREFESRLQKEKIEEMERLASKEALFEQLKKELNK